MERLGGRSQVPSQGSFSRVKGQTQVPRAPLCIPGSPSSLEHPIALTPQGLGVQTPGSRQLP